jgi:hypothetical protein
MVSGHTATFLHGKKRRARCSTGLNNVLLPTLFTLVNNIEQCCSAWIGCNNIVQYCWQLWTMWAAKHYSILFSSVLHQPERFYACIQPALSHRIRRYSRSVTQASICPRFYKRFVINHARSWLVQPALCTYQNLIKTSGCTSQDGVSELKFSWT